MSRLRRSLGVLLKIVAAVLAACLLLAVAIIGSTEWRARTTEPAVPPRDYAVTGAAGDAPVLIMLHGAGLNGHMWDPVARHIDPALRVIALDLPGHGTRHDEVFSPESARATVAAAARSVAPAPVILVGDSLGGYSAMAAASALQPQQLRGLVLAGCSSNFGNENRLKYLRDVVMITVLGWFIDEADFGRRALLSLGVSDADARTIVAAGVHTGAVPVSARSLLGVDFRAMLAQVTQPVLIVNGDLDARAVGQEDSFVAAAPNASAHRFENTRHGVSMLRSADFAAVINRFSAQVLATTGALKP